MRKNQELMPVEVIANKIYFIRGIKVMLDNELALLYGVETRALVQAVKRNKERFPADFMFQLSEKEDRILRSQTVMTKNLHGGRRYNPYAFTEHGVAMLSSVLKSKRAVQVNIAIIRAFIKLRELLATHKDLVLEISKIKKEQKNQNQKIVSIISIINQMINPPIDENKEPIGFRDRTKK